ncbi:hypothetical protein [Streptomyces venezuelae]|uniref:hypothetical protein n=1 Tax=Streptomyces venezuelae TaxID=54571 RepID=UPI003333303A
MHVPLSWWTRAVAGGQERQPGPRHLPTSQGDTPVALSCLPRGAAYDLPPDVYAAVVYLRNCKSRLTNPDAEEFTAFGGVEGLDRARGLMAAAVASGYVDYKKCRACPAAHLCTKNT